MQQDANLVILLHVEGKNHGETAESGFKDVTVSVEKGRGTRTGDVATYFTGPFQRVTEGAQEPAEQSVADMTQGRSERTTRVTRGAVTPRNTMRHGKCLPAALSDQQRASKKFISFNKSRKIKIRIFFRKIECR